MYTVDDIGLKEEALFKRMPAQGYLEQRDKFLDANGLYDAWREIYSKYVKLAQDGNIEALKRALFFAWYQLAEPSWLSGINELPDNETLIVVTILEELLEHDVEDQELDYMLPYYMAVCSYYLERFYPLPNIEKASSKNSNDARSKAKSSSWDHRGQMGAYWG